MASDLTKVKLGPCKVTFDHGGASPVVFETTQGGVTLNYSETLRGTRVDQYGDTDVKDNVVGRAASVEIPFAEYSLEALSTIIPGSTLTVNSTSGAKRLDVDAVNVVDLYDYAKKVKIEPLEGTAEDAVILYKAAANPNISYTYDYNNERVSNVTFKAYPDGANKLVAFGDETA